MCDGFVYACERRTGIRHFAQANVAKKNGKHRADNMMRTYDELLSQPILRDLAIRSLLHSSSNLAYDLVSLSRTRSKSKVRYLFH